PGVLVVAALSVAVAQRRYVPAPPLEVDDLPIVGEPEARSRSTDSAVWREAGKGIGIEDARGRHACSDNDGTGILLEAGDGVRGQVKVLVAVAGRLHDHNALGDSDLDRGELGGPELHGHIFVAGAAWAVQLDQDDVPWPEFACGVLDGPGS